jgi:glycerophosphoryl diester phosphodiesterase
VVRSYGAVLLGVATLYQLALALVVGPVTAASSAIAVLDATGAPAAVNGGLARLLTSPVSLLALAVAGLAALSADRIAAGASASLVLAGSRGAWRATLGACRQLGRLLAIALWQYGLMLAYSLPAIATAGVAYMLAFGIRDPVGAYARQPQALTWIAGLLSVTLALLWSYLSLRWLFAIPAFVDGGYRGRAALRRSHSLTSGRWLSLGVAIVALGTLLVLVGGVVRAVASSAVLAQGLGGNAWLLMVLIGLDVLASVGLALAGFVGVQSLVLARYLAALGRAVPPRAESQRGLSTWLAVAAMIALASLAGVAGVLLATALVTQPPDPTRVQLIAHRAGEAYAPENSLAAVTQARKDEAGRLEFDVQRTADGHLVVIHDPDLLRLSGQDVSIGSSTLAQVQAIDIGEGQRVPTLEQFLDAADTTPLALEIKTHAGDRQTTREVVALLQRRGAVERTVLMSLDPALPRLARDLDPALRTADLVSVAVGETYLLPAEVIAPTESMATARLVAAAHSAGKEVWVWAVDDDTLIRGAVLRGVDGLIVSDVPKTRQVLETMPTITKAEVVRQRLAEVLYALEQ